jgi:DNA adenine methylase
MTVPTRPALRWYGSKWRIAPWIIGHFPAHRAYCEPYGGSASVLLRKPPAMIETWNDLDQRLVNFFRVLRERTDELIRAVQLTPYARAEYELSRTLASDPLEDARRFYVLTCQGRGGAAVGYRRSGFRVERDPASRPGQCLPDEFDAEHFWSVAARLKHVQIEDDDAFAVLRRYDTPATLHYVDPPYPIATREGTGRYSREMSDDDHRALAKVLHQLAGMVVLSGYPSALYDDLYAGWERVERATIADSAKVVTEALWLNLAAAAAQRQHRLFTEAGP